MLIANVWIEHPIFKVDKPFSYQADGFKLTRGIRVVVDFNGQRLVGFVDKVYETELDVDQYEKENGFSLKKIMEVIDESPLINQELYELGKWMALNTISPRIACYQAMLPPKISPKSNNNKIKYIDHVHLLKMVEGLSNKQTKALMDLDQQDMIASLWRKDHGNYTTKTLISKGYVEIYQKEARYQADEHMIISDHLTLTDDQMSAYQQILSADDRIYLLHGATGSGKTEIYLHLAQRVIDMGKQVLILVPEISLTPQMVERVQTRFGDKVAIYHSALNDQEKYEQFKRVDDNEVAVVVGTRSAAFMPFHQLGLIVMDEEHDHSYKQEKTPSYHCRDIVINRATYHDCKVVLGSATPALESYARAQKGVYHLIELPQRINKKPLPTCRIIDVKTYLRKGMKDILTPPLKEAISDRLSKKQQVILLLNRRGYTPIQQCLECNHVIKCPDCDIAMNYHKDKNKLVCHTCGTMIDFQHTCPSCHGNKWIRMGYGTQKLEEELAHSFPTARLLRMDADTTTKKHAHQKILDKFGAHQADILLGTQMIAKGLDYPLVTLVGVLSADAALARDDFRSVETTFDLIVQASGRSGRGRDVGEVYIQAFDPDHYAIQTASRHDYQRFYGYEMQYRHAGGYPPYTYLIAIVFSSDKLERLQKEVNELAAQLRDNNDFKVLGPTELYKTFRRYRMRIVLKGRDLALMIKMTKTYMDEFINEQPAIKVTVDVNPMRIE